MMREGPGRVPASRVLELLRALAREARYERDTSEEIRLRKVSFILPSN